MGDWKAKLVSELPVWPTKEVKSETRLVRVMSHEQLSAVVKTLDEDGVGLKAPTMALAGVRLQPGDRLWLTGDLEGKTLEDLRVGGKAGDTQRVSLPATLIFVPCLRVEDVCVLE